MEAPRSSDSGRERGERPTVNYEDQDINWMDFSDTEDKCKSDGLMPSLVEQGGSSDNDSKNNNEPEDNIPGLTTLRGESSDNKPENNMPGLLAHLQSDNESRDSENDTAPDLLPRNESNILIN